MNGNMIKELIFNASLLLALSIVYEVSYLLPKKWKMRTAIFNGCLIGFIGVAIMTVPFQLSTGIVFDTRSILISVTALTFGTVPVVIAAFITIIYRISMGGVGVSMGVAVILSSAAVGLLWRHLVFKRKYKYRFLNIYIFGIIVHIVMLSCTIFMPSPTGFEVLKQISLPVMLIYPIGTVLLSMLLLNQKARNEAAKQILEAEGRYRSLFDNNHAIMLLIDPQGGRIIDANLAASSFYGWTIEVIKSMNISQINTLPPEKISIEMRNSEADIKNVFIFKHRKASGQIADVEVYSGPIKISGRTVIYSIVHDISERIAMDKALLESENRFRSLVEGAPYAIFIQKNKIFSFVNQAALELFGADTPEQLLGSSVMERFHPAFIPIIEERISQLNIGKKSVPPNEEVFLRLDGTPVDVDVTAIPIHYTENDGAIVFARDITERKKLESIKAEMEAQLRQQQKLEAIGTLAGGVAHEVNNPINGIMNYAQLILDSLDEQSSNVEYAKEIIHETERISGIVKNLLQFSRQEKQSHSYANVYDIVDQTVSLIKTIIKKDQINFIIELDEGLPEIKCRSQQIQQVLMNLLTNARDALNEKYAEFDENKIIRLTCEQFISEERRWIRLIVEDHGNGIPKKIQEKIYEPFFSTKPKDKGTGLGLFITFGIVKDHHGKLIIDTKEGSYTRFILVLPIDNGWEI